LINCGIILTTTGKVMALHPSQNPYYCRDCNDTNPRYTMDFKCEACDSIVWTKIDKQREEDREEHEE